MFNKDKTQGILKEAIIKTVAFFDMFDYPLTAFEIRKWLFNDSPREAGRITSLNEINNILESGELKNAIETKSGFYFLSGRKETIEIRMERYNYTDRKFKLALRIAKLFKFVPWIKMIAVSNIMGAHNLKDKGDIDLFIVTEKKRIWATRFFCTGLVKLLGLRPKKDNMRDKICLSFFISEDNLNLKNLMIDSNSAPDIYFIYWLACLTPIFNRDGIYKKIIESNGWLNNYLPNWEIMKPVERRSAGKSFSNFYRDVIDMLVGGTDQILKKLQIRLMPQELKEAMNKNTKVVINDQILKFHVNDRRNEYLEKYAKTLKEISAN